MVGISEMPPNSAGLKKADNVWALIVVVAWLNSAGIQSAIWGEST